MDEIDGKKVGQCPYCSYQLIRAGNESPGYTKDGKDVIVKDLFLACPHCGYRGPIAKTWEEAMENYQRNLEAMDEDPVEFNRRKACEEMRRIVMNSIEALIRTKYNLDPGRAMERGSVAEGEYLKMFEMLKRFKILAAKDDGWRELVDLLS